MSKKQNKAHGAMGFRFKLCLTWRWFHSGLNQLERLQPIFSQNILHIHLKVLKTVLAMFSSNSSGSKLTV